MKGCPITVNYKRDVEGHHRMCFFFPFRRNSFWVSSNKKHGVPIVEDMVWLNVENCLKYFVQGVEEEDMLHVVIFHNFRDCSFRFYGHHKSKVFLLLKIAATQTIPRSI